MNCQNFESMVNELARQQMMEATVREEALAHTDECEACALRLADQRSLTQHLRALASEMSGVEAPSRMEDELLAAFRKNKFTQPRRSANYAWRYWATAAAAMLLIVIGIAAMSMRSRLAPATGETAYVPPLQPRIPAKTNDVKAPAPIDGVKPAEFQQQGSALAGQNIKRRKNSLPVRLGFAGAPSQPNALAADSDTTVAANFSRNEIATDFMPIGYTTPMNLQDGGQVMRVELPRSTLAGFGFPINMDRVNERVKADVLVGPDGQARAIRFVQ